MADQAGARYHNRLGYIRLNENNLEKALEEFTAATELDPGNTSFRYTKISVMEKLGKTGETVPEYDELIRLDPENTEYYLGKARALESQEHLNQALDTFDAAMEMHPHDPELHFEKSRFLGKYESYDSAIREIEKAIELNPEEPRYLHALCELYQIVEEDRIALMVYERLLGVDNCNPQYYYEKARILERTGKVDRAEKEMHKVAEMRPHSISWTRTCAEFFETHDLYEDALEMRSRLIELEPENRENLEERASLEEAMGHEEDAIRDLETARSMLEDFRKKHSGTA